jgi:hypothetical protein
MLQHPVETRGAGFLARDALPEPLLRTTSGWVDRAWEAHMERQTESYFD